jgi:hypothetical protein
MFAFVLGSYFLVTGGMILSSPRFLCRLTAFIKLL